MCGDHPGKRMTYGHTLVVDPWGEAIAEGGEVSAVVYADLDMGRVEAVRSLLPSLAHDRPFAPPAV